MVKVVTNALVLTSHKNSYHKAFVCLRLTRGFPEEEKLGASPDVQSKGTPHEKKCFLSGIARMRGGGRALPELKNTLYIFLYDGRKRCTSCPKEGEGGGGRGNSGNARKKTFIFIGGLP